MRSLLDLKRIGYCVSIEWESESLFAAEAYSNAQNTINNKDIKL